MKNSISQLRKKAGVTQEELATRAGVSRQTIIALEQNRYNPSLALAFRITQVLRQKLVEDVFKL